MNAELSSVTGTYVSRSQVSERKERSHSWQSVYYYSLCNYYLVFKSILKTIIAEMNRNSQTGAKRLSHHWLTLHREFPRTDIRVAINHKS